MEDGEYEDYLYEQGWFDHRPGNGYPRQGHIGEHVYADFWEKLMKTLPRYGTHAPNGMLADILQPLPGVITPRHAYICARVICWLGTNCGRGIIEGAKRRMADNKEFPENAFTATWAIENQRHYSVNHGYRSIEHLLAPPDHFGRDFFGFGITLLKRPELTVNDYETVEVLMRWLGKPEGQAFIRKCEAEIEELHRLERVAKKIGVSVV